MSFNVKSLSVIMLVTALTGWYFAGVSSATIVPTTVEAETMTLGGQTVVNDSVASASKAVLFATNSSATIPLEVSGTLASLALRAKGDQCQGAPQAQVMVDNVAVNTFSVSATGYTDYTHTFATPLAAGSHSLKVTYLNDFFTTFKGGKKNCNRNLYLDKITLAIDDGITPPPPPAGTQPPITREGTKLLRNGAQWKFAGLNADKFFGCWGAVEEPSDAQLDQYFSSLNPHSLTRIWVYSGSSDFPTMDRVVTYAEKHGQYLAVTLFDGNASQCGTQAVNKRDPQVNIDHMTPTVQRYAKGTGVKTTNAIAFWEISNEVGGTDSVNWFQSLANAIKALDPNTLVGSGTMPRYAFGDSQATYEAVHAGNMDLISIHEYDAATGMSHWAEPAALAARNLNKPWYAGEDGFCCNGGSTGSL